MNKLPAFLLYATDFIVGTAEMGLAETGAYIKLLCHQWDKGTLPNNAEKLYRLVGATQTAEQEVVNNILPKFEVRGKYLINPRLEAVRNAQQEFRSKRVQSAKKAAQARWNKEKQVPKNQLHLVQQLPPQLQALYNEIVAFFNVKGTAHTDKQNTVKQFLITLKEKEQLPHLAAQWQAYTSYKKGNGGPIHGFAKFIGQAHSHYLNGAWNAENWQAKLEQHGNAKSIARKTKTNASPQGKREYTQGSSPIIPTSKKPVS